MQVKALVELITSLMCIMPSTSRPRSTVATANHFQEMMRAMVDAGVRKALLQVLRGLDTNHPKVEDPLTKPCRGLHIRAPQAARAGIWRELQKITSPDPCKPRKTQDPSTLHTFKAYC